MKKFLELLLLNIGSLGSLASVCDLERYLLTLVERLEPIALDCAEVNENIATLIRGDETIALSCVEPFYCAVAFQSVASQQEIIANRVTIQLIAYLSTLSTLALYSPIVKCFL